MAGLRVGRDAVGRDFNRVRKNLLLEDLTVEIFHPFLLRIPHAEAAAACAVCAHRERRQIGRHGSRSVDAQASRRRWALVQNSPGCFLFRFPL